MRVRLRFFAGLREHLGTAEREIEKEGGIAAREIFSDLFRDPAMARLWLRSTRFAVNGEYVPQETIVHDGDEVAFIPPVSGG